MAKGVVHAGKKLGLSSGNADENERKINDKERKGEKKAWDEKTYRNKNKIPWNNYDWSRHSLNFEIARSKDGKPTVIPLGSQDVTLYRRYQKIIQDVGFKQYKVGASNQQLTYMELILSGSTKKMQKLAFGDQNVDFTRNPQQWKNWGVTRTREIEQWALDCYEFMCKKYGEENIIGFEVHLDETEPHIHVNIVPTAIMQQRGRNGGYHKVDADGNPVTYTKGKHIGEVIKISESKYNALSEDKKAEYRPNERGTVHTISYAYHFGGNKPERSAKMFQLHNEFHEHVGSKWGFDRGDIWAELPEEERRRRKRRTKQQAYEEEEAKKAKDKVLEETNTATEKLKEVEEKLDAKEKDLEAAQKDLGLIKKVQNLMEENLEDYIHALPDVEISVTKDIRAKLASPMKEHTRILTSINPPMSLQELERVLKEVLEAVIMDKGIFLSKEDRNRRMRDIVTDMTTIMIEAAGGKQKKEITAVGRKLYLSIRSEMADAVSKALKYDSLKKEGFADVNQAKRMKEAASRTKATEDMLEFSWPGVTKAKEILINPELDQKYMSKEERNEVLGILRNDKNHPEDRIADMFRLLKYACEFRNIPLATQVEALMLSTEKAITYIKENTGCDFIGGANNMMATIWEQIEKPAEAVNQIAASAACLFFGFADAATTISTGSGGGGGGDSELPKKKDDENDMQFAVRCLVSAAQMRLPTRRLKKGR
ncbi:MAG: plasmid recombination protein [Prevotella sp.]|nr:plasmid recombination protein [Prevotella sp.]